jgi:hypothetical protein
MRGPEDKGMNQTVSYLWREPRAAEGFAAGVSLHSHTNQSRETLDLVAELSTDWPWLQPVMRWAEARCVRLSGIHPDYVHSYWTPPLTPRLAFDLERRQIENTLQLPAMVSITDHDNIQAPLLLRSLPSARRIPVSVEWTVPFAARSTACGTPTCFHLGIHNLPSATGPEWMLRLAEFTAMPPADRAPELLGALLAELDSLPGVLIVFNHPMWDLYRIGKARHRFLVNEFLALHGQCIHALELNGLRNWDENKEVTRLAESWNQLLISGGDRHCTEPNANLNLTRAASFTGFVEEVRRERRSHVLFMPQYRQAWRHRILRSTLDAVRNFPDFPEGSRRWDERVYHPAADGEIRPLAELWTQDRAPVYISAVISLVRLLEAAPVSTGLRMVWDDSRSMRAALTEKAEG